MLYGPRDIRYEELPTPRIEAATDAIIRQGKVFDLTLPLEQVADGYKAMDERRAIKALLRP